jgi:hypothetical protein
MRQDIEMMVAIDRETGTTGRTATVRTAEKTVTAVEIAVQIGRGIERARVSQEVSS